MGIIRERIKKAFEEYDKGNLREFVTRISDASDVGWPWHKGIVDAEIDSQLKLRGR